jgi:hypothetical protein
MTPGSDILAEAFSCIDTHTVQYIKAGQRTKNRAGQFVSELSAEPVDYEASVQAVDRKSYVELGLDMNRRYYNIYLSASVQDFAHGTTGDRIEFGTKKYDVESNNDWFAIDGWVGLLCVEVQF